MREDGKNLVRAAAQVTVTMVTMYLVSRYLLDPDRIIRARMATARAVARFAKTQADFWPDVAAKADTAYLKARNSIL